MPEEAVFIQELGSGAAAKASADFSQRSWVNFLGDINYLNEIGHHQK